MTTIQQLRSDLDRTQSLYQVRRSEYRNAVAICEASPTNTHRDDVDDAAASLERVRHALESIRYDLRCAERWAE